MNDNAKKWVAALRSGEFTQGRRALRPIAVDGSPTYCCLGVACEVYLRETDRGQWEESVNGDAFNVDGDSSDTGLPTEVLLWLGLDLNETEPSFEGCFVNPEGAKGESEYTYLATKNDDGATFDEIADLIESEPVGLFA